MMKDLTSAFRPAFALTILFALLLGLAYPAAITGVGQLLFPAQANGSLIRDGETVRGSALLGQNFAAPGYFHGRLSAAGADGNDPTASAGSNLGPTSQDLADRIRGDLAAQPGAPTDLVTTSASGLDPHVTPEGAFYQVDRVAAARGIPAAQVRELVVQHTEQPFLAFLGEPRVNVLMLNRALDAVAPARAR